jgi:GNAT superfamily N-acetyltransferase
VNDDRVSCAPLLMASNRSRRWKVKHFASDDQRSTAGASGLGIGRRLLIELEGRAEAEGVHVVRLETNKTLTEAIALYSSAGYRQVDAFNDEPYAHYWFERRLGAS